MISDTFWLNMGAEVVYKTLDNRVAAVARLQSTIVWIFGIYSTITIGTAVFADKNSWSSDALFLFGIAFLFLIISYWVATAAALPRIHDFYGSAVESIRDAYLKAVKGSVRTFTWAIVLCSLGVLSYSSALFLQFSSPAFNKYRKVDVPNAIRESDSLFVQAKPLAANKFALQVQSRKNSWINYTILSDTTIDQQIKTDEIPFMVQSTTINNIWVHIDTSTRVNQVIEFVIRPNRKYQLSVSRTDTLNNGSVLYTVCKKMTLVP